jgi:hypothetical protein
VPWLAFFLVATTVIVVGVNLAHITIRRSHNKPIKVWVQSQPVTFTTRALVRERRLGGWVDWSNSLGGGPTMTIRARGIEVSAPQGMVLESRSVFISAEKATMSIDSVGWAGTPVGRRKCVRLLGHDPGCAVDLAISPDADFDEAWQALIDAGVQPT